MGNFSQWSGNIEDLVDEANHRLALIGKRDNPYQGPLTIRVIRDYIQRGLLGDIRRLGKESLFVQENLNRLLAIRFLLADGWPLAKIREHFDLSTPEAINSLVPASESNALRSIRRIREDIVQRSEPPQPDPVLKSAARMSGIQAEMAAALSKLGLSGHGPMTEELTLIAIAPWCQVLIEADRLSKITVEEAEEIGRAITGSILTIANRKRK
jgi:DNA-binding transcriptional MerR regulator